MKGTLQLNEDLGPGLGPCLGALLLIPNLLRLHQQRIETEYLLRLLANLCQAHYLDR